MFVCCNLTDLVNLGLTKPDGGGSAVKRDWYCREQPFCEDRYTYQVATKMRLFSFCQLGGENVGFRIYKFRYCLMLLHTKIFLRIVFLAVFMNICIAYLLACSSN